MAVSANASTATLTVGRAPVDPVERRRIRRRVARRRYLTVLLFMSPWIIGFIVFLLYPMLSSLYFSFTRYDLLSQPVWTGLSNYSFKIGRAHV